MEFVFLTYIDRSGSTFVLNCLNKIETIAVCPEGDLLFELFLRNPNAKISSVAEAIENNFYKDKKLCQWNFSFSEIELALQNTTNKQVFESLLSQYAKRVNPLSEVVVIKALEVIYLKNVISENYKNIRLIRDPRACFVSQKKAGFNSNPFKTAKYWAYNTTNLDLGDSFSLYYEDLIKDYSNSFSQLLDFINVENNTKLVESDSSDYIFSSTLHLHKNINSSPLVSRIYAWKTEIKSIEKAVIDYYLRRNSTFALKYQDNYDETKLTILLTCFFASKHYFLEKSHNVIKRISIMLLYNPLLYFRKKPRF